MFYTKSFMNYNFIKFLSTLNYNYKKNGIVSKPVSLTCSLLTKLWWRSFTNCCCCQEQAKQCSRDINVLGTAFGCCSPWNGFATVLSCSCGLSYSLGTDRTSLLKFEFLFLEQRFQIHSVVSGSWFMVSTDSAESLLKCPFVREAFIEE